MKGIRNFIILLCFGTVMVTSAYYNDQIVDTFDKKSNTVDSDLVERESKSVDWYDGEAGLRNKRDPASIEEVEEDGIASIKGKKKDGKKLVIIPGKNLKKKGQKASTKSSVVSFFLPKIKNITESVGRSFKRYKKKVENVYDTRIASLGKGGAKIIDPSSPKGNKGPEISPTGKPIKGPVDDDGPSRSPASEDDPELKSEESSAEKVEEDSEEKLEGKIAEKEEERNEKESDDDLEEKSEEKPKELAEEESEEKPEEKVKEVPEEELVVVVAKSEEELPKEEASDEAKVDEVEEEDEKEEGKEDYKLSCKSHTRLSASKIQKLACPVGAEYSSKKYAVCQQAESGDAYLSLVHPKMIEDEKYRNSVYKNAMLIDCADAAKKEVYYQARQSCDCNFPKFEESKPEPKLDPAATPLPTPVLSEKEKEKLEKEREKEEKEMEKEKEKVEKEKEKEEKKRQKEEEKKKKESDKDSDSNSDSD